MPIEEKPSPAYKIITERLVLRCWEPKDAVHQKSAIDASREHLKPWMPWAWTDPDPIETVFHRLRSFRGQFDLDQNFVYGIFNLNEDIVLGGSGLHPRIGEGGIEIGYWIHIDYTGNGYATEAVTALTRIAFEVHRVDRVEIHCEPDNLASASIPRKLGFMHEATLARRTKFKDKDWRGSMIWTLFISNYPTTPSAQIKIKAFDGLDNRII